MGPNFMNIALSAEVEDSIRSALRLFDDDALRSAISSALALLDERDEHDRFIRSLELDEQDKLDSEEWTPELMERLNREADILLWLGIEFESLACPPQTEEQRRERHRLSFRFGLDESYPVNRPAGR